MMLWAGLVERGERERELVEDDEWMSKVEVVIRVGCGRYGVRKTGRWSGLTETNESL